jgi:hypothetical protein
MSSLSVAHSIKNSNERMKNASARIQPILI